MLALFVIAGMDWRALARTSDPIELTLAQVVAERVLEARGEIESVRRDNLATAIANRLGKILGRLFR